MAIHIQTLQPKKIGYKMASFQTWNPYISLTSARDNEDWSGIYIAPNENKDVAEGYADDYINPMTNEGCAYLSEVHLLHPIKLLFCDNETLGASTVLAEEKTGIVREELAEAQINIPTGPLIPQLGRQGYCFMGYHDEMLRKEIIFPNKLSAYLILMKPKKYKYNKRLGRVAEE